MGHFTVSEGNTPLGRRDRLQVVPCAHFIGQNKLSQEFAARKTLALGLDNWTMNWQKPFPVRCKMRALSQGTVCVIFLEMSYLRGEGLKMFRSAAAAWMRFAILFCVLAAPRLTLAAGPSAHCADDDANRAGDPTQTLQASPAQTSRSPLIGTEAPDFTLKDPAGRVVHLRDLRGKVVLIDFWASQCPSSRAEMPYLQQLHDQYGEKGLAVLGLDIGEDASQVNEFATDSAYTFPLLVGADPDLLAKYSVAVYPMTFVIDRNGKIIFAGSPTDEPGAILRSVRAAVAKNN